VASCFLFSEKSEANDVVLLVETLAKDERFLLEKNPEEGTVFELVDVD
jgi:hypothetical protein